MKVQNKPIITNSNIRDFINSLFIPVVFIFPFFAKETALICVCLFIVLEYILSIIFFNFYNFYEDYIEIYYPMRIGKWRKRRINYADITLIKYFGDLWYDPIIKIYRFGKTKSLHLPSNSVISRPLKKTRKTLLFLQSKGIPVEIISEDEKKQRILD